MKINLTTLIWLFILWILWHSCVTHKAHAHDWHLWDTQTLTSVRMQYCEGYVLVDTKEYGIVLIERGGDLKHSQLHLTKVDEYDCVYEMEPLRLEEDE